VDLKYRQLPRSAATQLGSTLTAVSQVVLEIVDRGHGMTAAVKARLFEPFFTTKPTGQGTGLGLAAVHGLVSQNHGAIEIESEVGRGTTVRVFLAELDRARRPEWGNSTPAPAPVRHHVLLVDADATTNKTAVFALEQAGFQVTVVGHGPDAVKHFHQAVPEIHLAIVSATFPGLSGRELAGILRGLQPGLPVLFVSGRFEVPAGWPADEQAWPLLLKPFRAEDLLKQVEAMLPEKTP
jgi:CheY-like chemotaxis protein